MRMFEKNEFKLLWPFYLATIISTVLYIYPAFYIIVLQEQLSLIQIGFLLSALSLSSFIFEFPTGVVADIFGRKFSVLIGYFTQGILVISITYFSNFYSLLVLFFLWGVFGTFITGASDAWVVDNLKYKNKFKIANEYFIKEHSLKKGSLVLAGIIGSVIVSIFGTHLIWLITGLSYIFSGMILSFVSEHRLTKENKESFSVLFKHTKKSMSYSVNSYNIRYLLLALFFVSAFTIFSGRIITQPFLLDMGFPTYAFGLFFSFVALGGAIAPYFAKPFIKLFKKEKTYLSAILFVQILIIILVLFVNNWIIGASILILLSFAYDIYNPIRKSYFQKFIPGRMRASISSLSGTVVALSYIFSAPLAGYFGGLFGPKMTLFLSGILLIPAVIFYLKIGEKEKENR